MQQNGFFWKRRQVLASLGLGSLGAWALGQRPLFGQVSAQENLGSLTWADILAQARGSQVNWAMWSGSEAINGFVDGWVKTQLRERYDIRLNRIPLTDTVEAVNKVIGEVQAGLRSGGSIDLIWINGNNFRTLKQGDLLYGPFAEKLPSLEFYNPDDIATDFGLPIEGYSAPYTGNYFVMAYNAERVPNPPRSYAELLTWAEANPGRFTYVAPPDFHGSRFLLGAFYGVTGGYAQYSGPDFDADLWAKQSPAVVNYLKELDPFLWRQGQTYPPTFARLAELFANGEVWLIPTFIDQVILRKNNGQFPASTTPYGIPGTSLIDPSFTAIPVNAANPFGAMILAEVLASPEGQLEKFKPDVWGDLPLIDISRVPAEFQTQFAQLEAAAGIPIQEAIAGAVPIVNSEYTVQLEEAWQRQVLPG
ncbi:ABC transporter substrate-binding protein [Thermostichus vulcanus]|uniref:ABC transporter substrate-binding protein n=1 Tax=Thermostichus vulcanus str. 'Rupite' TaxID=2813851 RepID=A0ABT0CBH4_THEVL|nr:ABC transporter substrate-binding protein [Thermostichus vulcanus]MCJ2543144.1 ABC transporter substrate-binding protein [Thermostichus vulcanus str. 'Rupite']